MPWGSGALAGAGWEPEGVQDTRGPGEAVGRTEGLDMVLERAGPWVMGSVVERWLASLDGKSKLEVTAAWRTVVQQAPGEHLPALPLPMPARPAKKRARVLREGQLSLIVYGFDEKLVWARRVGSFIRSMRAVLGDRSLQARWGGSLIDSVVGTYLTQNVSDVLSSSAFMSLAARFPSKKYAEGLRMLSGAAAAKGVAGKLLAAGGDGKGAAVARQQRGQEDGDVRDNLTAAAGPKAAADAVERPVDYSPDIDSTLNDSVTRAASGRCSNGAAVVPAEAAEAARRSCSLGVGEDMVDWEAVRTADPMTVSESIRCRGMQHMLTVRIQKFLNQVLEEAERGYGPPRGPTAAAGAMASPLEAGPATEATAAAAAVMAVAAAATVATTVVETVVAGQLQTPPETVSVFAEVTVSSAEAEGVDNSVEPPAVTVACIADAVVLQGGSHEPEQHQHQQEQQQQEQQQQEQQQEQQQPEGQQVQEPDEADLPVVRLSLEWLRGLSDEEATKYLMSVAGLGRKSTACVMLLALGRKEFPVDTNVARVCARLGWIPLQGDAALEDLDQYPEEPEVHIYLHKRLMVFDLQTLYELHYLMITLGKVFCQKQLPNCNACPLAPSCDYARCNGPRLNPEGAPMSRQQQQQAKASRAQPAPSHTPSAVNNGTRPTSDGMPAPAPVPVQAPARLGPTAKASFAAAMAAAAAAAAVPATSQAAGGRDTVRPSAVSPLRGAPTFRAAGAPDYNAFAPTLAPAPLPWTQGLWPQGPMTLASGASHGAGVSAAARAQASKQLTTLGTDAGTSVSDEDSDLLDIVTPAKAKAGGGRGRAPGRTAEVVFHVRGVGQRSNGRRPASTAALRRLLDLAQDCAAVADGPTLLQDKGDTPPAAVAPADPDVLMKEGTGLQGCGQEAGADAGMKAVQGELQEQFERMAQGLAKVEGPRVQGEQAGQKRGQEGEAAQLQECCGAPEAKQQQQQQQQQVNERACEQRQQQDQQEHSAHQDHEGKGEQGQPSALPTFHHDQTQLTEPRSLCNPMQSTSGSAGTSSARCATPGSQQRPNAFGAAECAIAFEEVVTPKRPRRGSAPWQHAADLPSALPLDLDLPATAGTTAGRSQAALAPQDDEVVHAQPAVVNAESPQAPAPSTPEVPARVPGSRRAAVDAAAKAETRECEKGAEQARRSRRSVPGLAKASPGDTALRVEQGRGRKRKAAEPAQSGHNGLPGGRCVSMLPRLQAGKQAGKQQQQGRRRLDLCAQDEKEAVEEQECLGDKRKPLAESEVQNEDIPGSNRPAASQASRAKRTSVGGGNHATAASRTAATVRRGPGKLEALGEVAGLLEEGKAAVLSSPRVATRAQAAAIEAQAAAILLAAGASDRGRTAKGPGVAAPSGRAMAGSNAALTRQGRAGRAVADRTVTNAIRKLRPPVSSGLLRAVGNRGTCRQGVKGTGGQRLADAKAKQSKPTGVLARLQRGARRAQAGTSDAATRLVKRPGALSQQQRIGRGAVARKQGAKANTALVACRAGASRPPRRGLLVLKRGAGDKQDRPSGLPRQPHGRPQPSQAGTAQLQKAGRQQRRVRQVQQQGAQGQGQDQALAEEDQLVQQAQQAQVQVPVRSARLAAKQLRALASSRLQAQAVGAAAAGVRRHDTRNGGKRARPASTVVQSAGEPGELGVGAAAAAVRRQAAADHGAGGAASGLPAPEGCAPWSVLVTPSPPPQLLPAVCSLPAEASNAEALHIPRPTAGLMLAAHAVSLASPPTSPRPSAGRQARRQAQDTSKAAQQPLAGTGTACSMVAACAGVRPLCAGARNDTDSAVGAADSSQLPAGPGARVGGSVDNDAEVRVWSEAVVGKAAAPAVAAGLLVQDRHAVAQDAAVNVSLAISAVAVDTTMTAAGAGAAMTAAALTLVRSDAAPARAGLQAGSEARARASLTAVWQEPSAAAASLTAASERPADFLQPGAAARLVGPAAASSHQEAAAPDAAAPAVQEELMKVDMTACEVPEHLHAGTTQAPAEPATQAAISGAGPAQQALLAAQARLCTDFAQEAMCLSREHLLDIQPEKQTYEAAAAAAQQQLLPTAAEATQNLAGPEAGSDMTGSLDALLDTPDAPLGTSNGAGIPGGHADGNKGSAETAATSSAAVDSVLNILEEGTGGDNSAGAKPSAPPPDGGLALPIALKVLRLPAEGELPSMAQVKQSYKELCILLHPDKSPHPRAVNAFAALTQALTAVGRAVKASARGGAGAGPSGGAGPWDADREVDDDEIFWVDASGTISVPAAAKQAAHASTADDPRWTQALVLLSQSGPQPGITPAKSRLTLAALPVSLEEVAQVVGSRASYWPDAAGSAAPYMLLFVRQASTGAWTCMQAKEVDEAVAGVRELLSAKQQLQGAEAEPTGQQWHDVKAVETAMGGHHQQEQQPAVGAAGVDVAETAGQTATGLDKGALGGDAAPAICGLSQGPGLDDGQAPAELANRAVPAASGAAKPNAVLPVPLKAVLLLPCWTAIQGAFPLNGTYFQTNEAFLDQQSVDEPLCIPWQLLLSPAQQRKKQEEQRLDAEQSQQVQETAAGAAAETAAAASKNQGSKGSDGSDSEAIESGAESSDEGGCSSVSCSSDDADVAWPHSDAEEGPVGMEGVERPDTAVVLAGVAAAPADFSPLHATVGTAAVPGVLVQTLPPVEVAVAAQAADSVVPAAELGVDLVGDGTAPPPQVLFATPEPEPPSLPALGSAAAPAAELPAPLEPVLAASAAMPAQTLPSASQPLPNQDGSVNPASVPAAAPQPQPQPPPPPPAGLPWKTVHFGHAASSICRDMGLAEVAHTFHRACLCIRAFDCVTGRPKALPPYLNPNPTSAKAASKAAARALAELGVVLDVGP